MARTLRRTAREIPLAYSDNFRSLFTFLLVPVSAIAAPVLVPLEGREQAAALVAWLCGLAIASGLAYLVWTHVLFSRAPAQRVREIAARQHRKPVGALVRVFGFNQQDAGSTALSSAALTFLVAVATIIIGPQDLGLWLPLLVLATAAVSWATMVYAFALQYLRLDAGGERITFDIDEAPEFADFLSMSVMVSSIGAMSAGTPRTRASLRAARSHTYIAFIFNALAVAMTVSIFGSLVSSVSL